MVINYTAELVQCSSKLFKALREDYIIPDSVLTSTKPLVAFEKPLSSLPIVYKRIWILGNLKMAMWELLKHIWNISDLWQCAFNWAAHSVLMPKVKNANSPLPQTPIKIRLWSTKKPSCINLIEMYGSCGIQIMLYELSVCTSPRTTPCEDSHTSFCKEGWAVSHCLSYTDK